MLVGRSTRAHLVFDDLGVSRRHALLRLAGRPMVRDMQSTNGTFVDGRRIEAGRWILVDRSARISFGDVAGPHIDLGTVAYPDVSSCVRILTFPKDAGKD